MNQMENEIKNATEKAYKQIKEMIAQYQLVPGQKITYAQLCEKLGMSKNPIINALNRLEQEEFVRSETNRGFFIREIEINELEELYKIREVLEMLSIEEAIKNYDDEGMKEIEGIFKLLQDEQMNYFTRNRLLLDATFHLKIAKMGKNKNLLKMLKYVLEHIYLRHKIENMPPKRMITTKKEHLEIIKGIKSKKIAKAKAITRRHILGAKIATEEGILLAATKLNLF